MNSAARILYADTPEQDRRALTRALEAAHGDFQITEAQSLAQLQDELRSGSHELVVSDLDIPGCEGLQLLDDLKARHPDLPVVIVTSDKERARKALERGAVGCVDRSAEQLHWLPSIIREAVVRKRLQQLRSVARARKVMAECSRLLMRATDEHQLFQDMCRIVVESGGYRMAWFGLARHDEQRTIQPVASAGDEDGYLTKLQLTWADTEVGRGPVGTAVRTRIPQTVRNVEHNPRFRQWRGEALARGYRAVSAFPLISDGEVLGALGVYATDPEAFDADEVALLDELAQDIAYGVANLRLRAARAHAEDKIEESERRFRATFDLVPMGIIHVAPDGELLLANPRMAEILGYRPGELVGRNIREFRLADDSDMLQELLAQRAKLHAGELPNIRTEVRYRHKDGSTVWVALTVAVHRNAEGKSLYDITTVEDITARKRAEDLLRLEHSVARSLAESDTVADGIKAVMRAVCQAQGWQCARYFALDAAANVLRFSESWGIDDPAVARFIEDSRLNVYGPGMGLAGKVWESGQPLWSTDITKDARMLRTARAIEAGIRGAFAMPVAAEGTTFGVLTFSSTEVRDPDERLLQAVRVIASQVGDFLNRKQTEEDFRRFRVALDNSADMIVLIDRTTMRFVDVNATVCRLLGYTREELLAMGPQDVLPASRETLEHAYDAFIADPSSISGMRSYYRCKDGTTIPFESTRRVLRSGDTYIIAAISRDIRERIASEEALRESNERFNLVVRATNDVIWDRNLVTNEMWWNENMIRAFGRGQHPRAPNESWHDDIHPGDHDRVVNGIKRVIDSGADSWSDEYRLRRADGTYAHVLDRGHVVRDSASVAIRMIGAMADITARKQAEETVRNQARQQRLIAEFGQQALASPDLESVLHRAVELVAGTLHADYCDVLELGAEGSEVTYRAAAGRPRNWIGTCVVPVAPGGEIARALASDEPYIVEDYGTQAESSPLEDGVRSGMMVRIPVSQRVFGLLSVQSLRSRRFTEDDVSFLRSVANILAVAVDRKHAEEKMARLAQFDTVTGLPNRYLFRDRLSQTLALAERNAWIGAVMFIDLDRFKAVNDTFGHAIGDRLLCEVAARLKECVRATDTVGRLSGDEFAVVLSNLAKADDAGLVAQKLLDAMALPFELDGHHAYVSASIGLALFPADGTEADALIKNADTAMYRAKEQGRNGYQYFVSQMNERLITRLKLEAQLRGALPREEFLLHYQPKVSLGTGAICGFEALLRWQHEDRLVSPAEFIPILEDTGLIVPVGEWVLRSVCEQIKKWTEQGITPRPVAVNLSARQFQRRELAAMVGRTLKETGVAPELLELELTETLLMSDAEEAVQMLRELKSLGVRLAVDDFGTGYSSLSYLKRFPLDTLKIDRAFIRDANTNPDDATITLTIISLAHSLKLTVVAEGVETEAQLNLLRAHGCDEMQGFYFSRPLPADDCTRALVEDRRLKSAHDESGRDGPALLIVDDNMDDLALLERALIPEGFRIVTAHNTAVGFELLARHGADVVICDHRMAEMTGVEFLRNVKKLYPQAVRVVITSYGDSQMFTDAINHAGIHKFLCKDWDANRLRAEVREAFRQRG